MKEEWTEFTEQQRVAKVKRMLEAGDFIEVAARAIVEFEGQCEVLESAMGAYAMGLTHGWQAMRVLHTSNTLKKYEAILKVDLRERTKQRTWLSRRICGIRIADGFDKFWKALGSGAFAKSQARVVSNTVT